MSDTYNIPSVPVRTAGLDDVATVAQTLALAFYDDPVFSWCFPDDVRRAALLPAIFGAFAASVVPDGELHLGAEAAAVWEPRGPGIEQDMDALVGELAGILGDDAERTFAIMGELEAHHPTDAHWYLAFLGVDPDVQGQGRGSGLLRTMLERCDREGSPAYLDATSPANRRLYERHGFVVLGERQVADSPTMWAMWREAR